MPIKSKPVNPQRATKAAKGRLSSGGAAYAEQQARLREQQRRWALEDEKEEKQDRGKDERRLQKGKARGASSSSSSSSSLSSSRATPTTVDSHRHSPAITAPPQRRQRSQAKAHPTSIDSEEEEDEAALLAAAQEKTKRFLHAGDDIPCGQAGPSPSLERLVAYEAAKRMEAMRAQELALDQADGESSTQTSPVAAVTTPARVRDEDLASPVTVRDVLEGLQGGVKPANGSPTSRGSPPAQQKASPPSSSVPVVAKTGESREESAAAAKQPTTYADPLQRDFERLMQMLAEDVRREHEEARMSTAAAAAAITKGGATSATSLRSCATIDGDDNDVLSRSSDSAFTKSQSSMGGGGYRPAPRTFAQLQANALQELYEKWIEGEAVGSDGLSTTRPAKPFVASDYEAAAFALAAAAAATATATAPSSSSSSAHRPNIADAPLSFEELAATEAAMRNATKARLVETRGRDKHAKGDEPVTSMLAKEYAVLSAKGIADAAQGKLSRFMQSLAWTERLVRHPVFVNSVAAFLYEHHRTFLPHFGRVSASADDAPSAAKPHPDGESALREHSHEEFSVYEQFAQRVSGVLLRVLADNVDGFDEEEFVEGLFDSPTEAYDMAGIKEGYPTLAGPQNVLSYPAWRIILSMSSFDSFFAWMEDYIQEEYQLGRDPVGEETVVAVGGTRGLRALIKSTYHRGNNASAHDAGTAVEEEAEEESRAACARDNRETPALEETSDVNNRSSTLSVPVASSPGAFGGGAGTASLSGSYSNVRLSGSSSLLLSMEDQLAHLRQKKRLFPTPPSSVASEASLRPRNSHLASGLPKNKKASVAAVRDLPPLASTPPPPEPPDEQGSLGGGPVSTVAGVQSLPERPVSQPTKTQCHASPTRDTATRSVKANAVRPRRSVSKQRQVVVASGTPMGTTDGDGAGQASRTRSTSSSRAHSTARTASTKAGTRKGSGGGVKPRLKRSA